MVEIWCDGSSTGRPNRAWGWAYVIAIDGVPVCCDYGGGPHGTNNTAELMAAIQGITRYAKMVADHPEWPLGCVLISDSMYTLGQATGKFQAHKNAELCGQLNALYGQHCTQAKHVRGHTGVDLQERCDRLAKLGKKLFEKP